MDDGTTKANPWQAVCEAMVTHVLRALQVIYDEFNVSLEKWLNDMVSHPIAEDWRGEIAAFVDETERKGLRILPGSVRVIEALIESRIAGTGQFARFGPAQRTRARARTVAHSASTLVSEADRQPAQMPVRAAPADNPDVPTGHRPGQSHSVGAQRLFDQQLASAKGHLNVLEQLLKVAGEKIDAARPDEEVDVGYEAEMVQKHLFLYNEDLIVARDLWLRFNLSSDANSRLIEMPTPVGLGLPMYSSPAQAERVLRQVAAIGRKLNSQNASMDAWVTGIALADLAATAAGVVASAGVLVAAAKKGGTWVVIKTVAAGAAMSYANKKAEGALRDQGVSEQTINGVRLAAAVITLILLHKVAKRVPSQAPPPESQTGVGGTPPGSEPAGPPLSKPGGTPPPKPSGPLPPKPAGRPPTVPPLRSTTAPDAINEITAIVARAPGGGAAKAAQVKALLEQAAKQGITGEGGTRIDFESFKGPDGSTIFLGGPSANGVRPALVIAPNGDVFRGGSSLTGANGITHFAGVYIPDYASLKKQ